MDTVSLTFGELVCLAPKRTRERALAVHRAEIEENIDREQIFRVGAVDPILHALTPERRAAAPLRVLRHYAAGAIRHADFVQNIRDMRAEFGKPAILGTIGIAALEDESIVLIHGKQAFAAARGAEHKQGIRYGRIALARFAHAPLGDLPRAARQRAKFARNDRRHVPRLNSFI